ncbi:hypothetical protein [uncultured Lamprocystis sp.]|uniref:hypothetical protein n=1 Tax=uncultured Lamprocystis sp. TaxID=543132 RepID=UPI0025F59492|nr:hypothetical protein [uncultured Lamprocystis sp.]
MLVLALLAPAGSDPLAGLPQAQLGADDEQAAVYATVAWPDPRNPRFVTLGADRYLLSTRTGKQLWKARENSFSPIASWPLHTAVGTAWARLGAGTLVVATGHDDADRPLHRVVWWDSVAERFVAPLDLPAGLLVDDLAPIDADHALVCARVQPSTPEPPFDPGRFAALIARLNDGALSWETEDSAGLRLALLAADIRGPLADLEGVEDDPVQLAPPVVFNTRGCRWEMTAPPAALRHVRNLTIKHYLSGLELKDRTILAFGGLPPGCDPSSPGDQCIDRPAQPSYRYFPREDRWEEVPGLAIHFATGQNWDNGNSGIATRWSRNDALVRRNGDFVYLDSGNMLKGRSDSAPPLTTRLVRWRPGQAPQPLAPLHQGRDQATLLELADGRLVALGGQTRASAVAADGTCPDCATEIFDDKTGRWKIGPSAAYPGGRAVKLANGRIFKLCLTGWDAGGGYRAEIADAAFTRRQKLPDFPIVPFSVMDLAVVDRRVLVLPAAPYRHTAIWNDASRRWSVARPWASDPPLSLVPIDSRRATIRDLQSFQIVPIPR